MRWSHCEPTLEEILSEPIFRAVMEADGVNPHELETMLRQVAAFSRAVRNADKKQNAFFA